MTAATAPVKAAEAPEYTIENFRRHDGEEGRRDYYSAEVVCSDGRLGVDSVYGAWTIYEATSGTFTRQPGEMGGHRREVVSRLSQDLAKLVAADRAQAGEAATRKRR